MRLSRSTFCLQCRVLFANDCRGFNFPVAFCSSCVFSSFRLNKQPDESINARTSSPVIVDCFSAFVTLPPPPCLCSEDRESCALNGVHPRPWAVWPWVNHPRRGCPDGLQSREDCVPLSLSFWLISEKVCSGSKDDSTNKRPDN